MTNVTDISNTLRERDYTNADELVQELLATWEPEEDHWQPSDVMALSIALADSVGLRLDIFAEHPEIVIEERKG